MKYIWEEKDIVAGRFVCNANNNEKDLITFTYKIGYDASRGPYRYCLIAMSDGLILPNFTKGELIRNLNENHYAPMTFNNLIKSISETRDWKTFN